MAAQPTAISLLKTWSEFYFRWYTSEEAPALPLTPGRFTTVVSQFKEQDYASVGKLISDARDAHLGDGHPGTEFLAREARRATRSGTRSLGTARHDDPAEDPDTLPSFPAATGGIAEKTAVADSIESVAGMLGEDLRDQQGRPRLGGHSLRATGARRLARLAIPTAVISLMAWWSPQVILRDIRHAHLRGLTQEYRRRANSLGNTETYTFENVSKEMTPKMRNAIHDTAEGHKYQEERLKELEDRLDRLT